MHAPPSFFGRLRPLLSAPAALSAAISAVVRRLRWRFNLLISSDQAFLSPLPPLPAPAPASSPSAAAPLSFRCRAAPLRPDSWVSLDPTDGSNGSEKGARDLVSTLHKSLATTSRDNWHSRATCVATVTPSGEHTRDFSVTSEQSCATWPRSQLSRTHQQAGQGVASFGLATLW